MDKAERANRRYFREAYTTGVHGWGVLEPSPYAVEFLRHVRKRIPGGALLDLGCGEGRHAIAAAKLGFRVTAVDYEPRALERARKIGKKSGAPHVEFRQANALRLPFPRATFDVVLDYGCLHHQLKSDWPRYKSGLLRVLKPGGFYILSVFSPRFRMFRGAKRPWHIAQGSYRRCFTPQDLAGLFSGAFEFIAMTEQTGKDGGFHHCLMRRADRQHRSPASRIRT
ncbi:MAG TPA: class I SAM-dependent methyltransferase [Candidatus Bathyarchaeia archaeon]|nr:class I SAM-dependent methyltransferase [Candidatus Bathyarchaeia archaeon]